MTDDVLNWAQSATLGGITEVAVLCPIKKGRVPGERRTFEEKLRLRIESIQKRAEQGVPFELNRVSSIHVGRMIILRPEQYLVHSNCSSVVYEDGDLACDRPDGLPDTIPLPPGHAQIPKPIDDYPDDSAPGNGAGDGAGDGVFSSWLLVLVAFDGDLKNYFRDIAQLVGDRFDLIFDNCEDFPGTTEFEKFWAWIRRYQINCDLFYSAYPNLSVARIRQLEEFKRQFDEFVARARPDIGEQPDSIDEMFDEFLVRTQQYSSGFPAAGGTYLPNHRN